jgi:hypothetical protein
MGIKKAVLHLQDAHLRSSMMARGGRDVAPQAANPPIPIPIHQNRHFHGQNHHLPPPVHEKGHFCGQNPVNHLKSPRGHLNGQKKGPFYGPDSH